MIAALPTSPADSVPFPRAPRTLDEAKLPFDLVMPLILKTLHFSGELTGAAVAASLGLLLEIPVQPVRLAALSGAPGREGVEPAQQQGRHHQGTQPSPGPSPHACVVLSFERFRSHHCPPIVTRRARSAAPFWSNREASRNRVGQVVVLTALGVAAAIRR